MAQEGVGPLADVDAAGLGVRAHARRSVDRVAAQIVLECLVPDDAGDGEAAVDAHLHGEVEPRGQAETAHLQVDHLHDVDEREAETWLGVGVG